MTELTIKIGNNMVDAYTQYGVRMSDKFIDALELPCALKEPITNESRLENGTRVIPSTMKASRDVTLTFTIKGSTKSDFNSKKSAFLAKLMAGEIVLNMPTRGTDYYHLMYRSSTEYAHAWGGDFCKLTVKFTEYDPSHRTKN